MTLFVLFRMVLNKVYKFKGKNEGASAKLRAELRSSSVVGFKHQHKRLYLLLCEDLKSHWIHLVFDGKL